MSKLELYSKNVKYIHLPNIRSLFLTHDIVREICSYKQVLLTPTNHIFVNYKYIPSGKFIVYDDKKLSFYQKLALLIKFNFIKKPENLSGEYIWVYDIWSCNYYHWFSETLPKIFEIRKIRPNAKVLLPQEFKKYSYIEESLALLDLPIHWIEQIESSYKIQLLYTVYNNPINDIPDFDWQKLLVTHLKDVLTLPKDNAIRKVYVSRRHARYRKIVNEDELIPILNQHNYEIVYAEELTFQEQITLFSQTKILISMHGAALTNMMYMNEDSIVLEIRNKDWSSQPLCFFQLANNFNIQWNYLESTPIEPENNFNDVIIDSNLLLDKLNEIEKIVHE